MRNCGPAPLDRFDQQVNGAQASAPSTPSRRDRPTRAASDTRRRSASPSCRRDNRDKTDPSRRQVFQSGADKGGLHQENCPSEIVPNC